MKRPTNIRPCFWVLILNLLVVAGVVAAVEASTQASPSMAETGDSLYYDRGGESGQGVDAGADSTTLHTISNADVPSPTLKWTYTAPDDIWYLDSWGDGLATGDLNSDGVPDVVFGTKEGYVIAVSGANGTELWSYRVTTQTDSPVNADVVDVDGDGLLDVVATGMASKAIIYALERDGTVKWQTTGDYAEAVDLAYGDIDGDGDTDVVASVGTYSSSGGQVILIDGDSGDRVWSRYLGSGHPQGIDAHDVDGDGDMDVAVENYNKQVFLLDGADGSITWSRSKGWYGRDVIIEDVDDDGTYEIVSGGGGVTCYAPDESQEWVADPDSEGFNISASDVNGDGHTEVVFSSAFGGEFYTLEGSTGDTLWSRTRSGAHAVGDVNGDGMDDIVVGTIRFYGIDPPYSVDAVDGSNNPIWNHPLDSIHNEGGFGLVTVNLDNDLALEVVVANGTELIALDTVAPDLIPQGLEVTQAIQSITNTVTLVEGKRTYARFHVRTDGAVLAGVPARLSATRDGQSLGNPLQPDNPNMIITVTAAPGRGELDDSFYFELPPDWLTGTVQLTAMVNPDRSIVESDNQNNTFTSTITFQPTPPLTVTLIGISYITNHVTYTPRAIDYERITSWLRAAYPTEQLIIITRTLDFPGSRPTARRVNYHIARTYVFEAGNADLCPATRYFGLVHDGGGFMRGKAAGIPSCVASGPTGTPRGSYSWDTDGSYGDWYAGHELGHTLGRRHTLCDGDEAGPDPDYPHPDGRIGGPFYGFNVETLDVYTPTLWADVMSYCTYQWISDYTYEGIRSRLISETTQVAATASLASPSTDGYLVVLGDVNLTQGTAQLDVLYHLPDLTPSTRPATSTHTLRLLDAGDGLLAKYPFTPKEDTEAQAGEDLTAMIYEIVPYAAGTARVVVAHESTALVSRTVSANPPTVTVSYPNDGETLGQLETVIWSGSDDDGDPLTYALLYSADNGASWTTVATEITGTTPTISYTMRTDELAGSDAGRIRVLVSDGVNTAWDDATGLELPCKAPMARIINPKTEESYLDEQTVILTGQAYDREDGYLDDPALVWDSSLDGTLGSGGAVAVTGLAEGEHTITLRATDDDEMIGTATITLHIHTRPRLYLPLVLRQAQ
jgi:outer membrane protein assembly factor BamB